jgi:2-dehydro-3-deoxygluconokinase
MTLLTFGETPLRFAPADGGQLHTAREMRVYADGTESNAAAAAAAMGGEGVWVSKLPDTPLGRRVVSELRRYGVDTAVAWTDGRRQGLRFEEAGVRPREGTTLQDRSGGAMAAVEPDDLPMDELRAADAVFTGASTLALSGKAADTAAAVFEATRGTAITAAADLDLQPGLCSAADARAALDRLSGAVDVLVASEDDAAAVLDAGGGARELVTAAADEFDLELVVITRSERGALAMHDTPGTNVVHERVAVETETVDPAGGHAAFVGALLQRLVDGADVTDALSYGVAAGALARTVPGPYLTADRAELDRVVEESVDEPR